MDNCNQQFIAWPLESVPSHHKILLYLQVMVLLYLKVMFLLYQQVMVLETTSITKDLEIKCPKNEFF